jgi:hypothetical protein
MVNSITVPRGTPLSFRMEETDISGATSWVGPRIKLPSTSAGAFAPSGNSFASTYPGLLGSRVGGVGRSVRRAAGGDCDEIGFRTTKLTNSVTIRQRGTGVMCPFCGNPNCGEKAFPGPLCSRYITKSYEQLVGSPVSSQLSKNPVCGCPLKQPTMYRNVYLLHFMQR